MEADGYAKAVPSLNAKPAMHCSISWGRSSQLRMPRLEPWQDSSLMVHRCISISFTTPRPIDIFASNSRVLCSSPLTFALLSLVLDPVNLLLSFSPWQVGEVASHWHDKSTSHQCENTAGPIIRSRAQWHANQIEPVALASLVHIINSPPLSLIVAAQPQCRACHSPAVQHS